MGSRKVKSRGKCSTKIIAYKMFWPSHFKNVLICLINIRFTEHGTAVKKPLENTDVHTKFPIYKKNILEGFSDVKSRVADPHSFHPNSDPD